MDDPDIVPSTRTFHTICRTIGVNPEKARDKMDDWVDNHLDWVKQVTQSFLSCKRMSFEQFRLQWLHSSFPLNSAGILILARAYKIHVVVFFNDHFWTTDSRTGLDRCSVFLLYRGNLVFENSCRLTTAEFDKKCCLMKQLEKYYATPEADTSVDKLHARAKKLTKNMIESDPDYSVEEESSLPKDTSGSSEISSEISDHELDDVDIICEFMATTEPDSSPDDESDDSGIGHSPAKSMAFKCSQCARKRRIKDSLMCKNCSACKKDNNGNIMPEKQVDLEDILNSGDTDKDNGQTDNELPAIEAKETVPASQAKETVPASQAKETVPDIEENKKLFVKIKRIDFKANKEMEPKIKQTEEKEQVSSDSDSSSGSSIEEVAPKKARKPKSKIGLIVKDIMLNKYKRFVCPKRNCDWDYGSKRVLHRHLLNNHSGVKEFKCKERWEDSEKCTKTYPTKQQLDQHIRGKHRAGFEAYCGDVFTWPWE